MNEQQYKECARTYGDVVTDEYHFFYGGPFSNWYPESFFVDGVKYHQVEQYMMACKARVFGDQSAHDKIMNTKNPREQKSIGRSVKNFDPHVWEIVSKDVVFRAIAARARFNPPYASYLIATEDRLIVEASPTDRIWGIGLSLDDEKLLEKVYWDGSNWLGQLLTEARDFLKLQDSQHIKDLV